MRKIDYVLRLGFEHGRSKLEIARIINVSPTTVSDYLARAKLGGLVSPLPLDCDEASLVKLQFPPVEPSLVLGPAPARPTVYNELPEGVTPELLWQEYTAAQPKDYQYSAFF